MKLNKDALSRMIKEVIEEQKKETWLLSEMQGAGEFEGAYKQMADPEGPAQFCFITAHNPPGKSKHGKGFGYGNVAKQKELLKNLNSLGYNNYTIGHGVYGGKPEESIMVFSNDSTIVQKFKFDMIRLGKEYLQDAIVYAEKYTGATIDYGAGETPVHVDTGEPMSQAAGIQGQEGPRVFWRMMMVMLEPHKTGRDAMKPSHPDSYRIGAQSNLLLTGNAIQAKKDFYTVMKDLEDGKPRKSYIPFYDDEREEFIANPRPVRE